MMPTPTDMEVIITFTRDRLITWFKEEGGVHDDSALPYLGIDGHYDMEALARHLVLFTDEEIQNVSQ